MRISDDDLRRRSVIASDGLGIGEVTGLVLESQGWGVASILVKLHKDVADRIGAGRSMFHAGGLEIPTRLIQSVGDAVVLAVPIDGLRQVLPAAGEPASAH